MIRNLFLAMIGLVLVGCGGGGSRLPACPAGLLCLHEGNGAEPLTLDPAKAQGTWESNIIGDMMIGLTTEDAAGRPIPGMATSWETSPDGLVWTFHLRKAQWSDGEPVTADDFVFGMRRTLDPKTASIYASLLYFIKNAEPVNDGKLPTTALGVRALDPQTLQLTLEHPAPFLLEIAKHQTMFPEPLHVVERYGDAWVQAGHYVSNGPYVLGDWKLGDHILLKKNPKFYDAAHVCIDQVFYYPTVDAISAERRVRRGELDLNRDIQSNRIAFLRKPDEIPAYVHTHTYLGVAYLAFNQGPKGVAALRDRRVRLALDMAIDREFIARKLLRGGQVPGLHLRAAGGGQLRLGQAAGVGLLDPGAPPGRGARPAGPGRLRTRPSAEDRDQAPQHARPHPDHAGDPGRLENHRGGDQPGAERDPDRLRRL